MSFVLVVVFGLSPRDVQDPPPRSRDAYFYGGTLFLDEIGDLPLSMQVKLLLGFTSNLIPSDHEPVVVAAIGYPGDPECLPEKLRKKVLAAQKRKLTEEFVFEKTWGEAAAGIRQTT